MRTSNIKAIAERKAFDFYEWYDDILKPLDNKTQQAFLVSLFMYAFKGEVHEFQDTELQKSFEKVMKQIDDDREKAVKKLAERETRKCKDQMTKPAM